MKLRTINEAAKELNVSQSRLRRAVRAGQVNYLMMGNRQLVDVDSAQSLRGPEGGISINELSDLTGLRVSTIYRAVQEGWMPYDKRGRALVFDKDAAQAAIQGKMKQGGMDAAGAKGKGSK